jgi:hypothetical protein
MGEKKRLRAEVDRLTEDLTKIRQTVADSIRLANGYRMQAEKDQRALALEREREVPFIWDGKGTVAVLARHNHVHVLDHQGEDGVVRSVCKKNRWGMQCATTRVEGTT